MKLLARLTNIIGYFAIAATLGACQSGRIPASAILGSSENTPSAPITMTLSPTPSSLSLSNQVLTNQCAPFEVGFQGVHPAITISIASSGSGKIYSDATCSTSANSVTLPSTDAYVPFYFRDSLAEAVSINATTASYGGSTINFSVVSSAIVPMPPQPANAIMQVQKNQTPTSGTLKLSTASTFTQSNTSGNAIIVFGFWTYAAANLITVTDSLGNAYSALGSEVCNPIGTCGRFFAATNIRSGLNTVTLKASSTGVYMGVQIYEYAGLASSAIVDVASGASATTSISLASSPSITTTNANDLILAGFADSIGIGTIAAGAGWNLELIDPNFFSGLESKSVSSAGSYQATATLPVTNSDWIVQIVALKAGSATTSGSTSNTTSPSTQPTPIPPTPTPVPPSSSSTSSYYVLPGGTGNRSGSDWANASCKLPSSLSAGEVIYIGNVIGQDMANTAITPCAEPTHTFNGNGTAAAHIVIKAATAIDHGTNSGWISSYGVDVNPGITWSNNALPGQGLQRAFWIVCGNYFDFLGQVGTIGTGTAQPAKMSFGFRLRSAGQMFGFIAFDPMMCGGAAMQNLNVDRVELDGVDANSYNCHTGNCANVDSGGNAFYPGGGLNTVSNIMLSNSYFHDIAGMIDGAGPITNMTLAHMYIDTNFSCGASPTPCNQHSNAIDENTQVTQGIAQLTVYDSVFRNIQGTGIITCLNGVCDGWKIYNNVFFYSSDWDLVCEHGLDSASCGIKQAIGDNGLSSAITNGVIYGNTFAGIHLKPGHPGADTANVFMEQPGSTGNTVVNNLWYHNTQGSVFTSYVSVVHDYNLYINNPIHCPMNSCVNQAHEFSTASGSADPFVSDGTGNYRLSTGGQNYPAGCTLGVNCLSNGAPLVSPYNLDFSGQPRGGANGWSMGAYQY